VLFNIELDNFIYRFSNQRIFQFSRWQMFFKLLMLNSICFDGGSNIFSKQIILKNGAKKLISFLPFFLTFKSFKGNKDTHRKKHFFASFLQLLFYEQKVDLGFQTFFGRRWCCWISTKSLFFTLFGISTKIFFPFLYFERDLKRLLLSMKKMFSPILIFHIFSWDFFPFISLRRLNKLKSFIYFIFLKEVFKF